MKKIAIIAAAAVAVLQIHAKENPFTSPDGRISASLETGEHIALKICHDGKPIMTVGDIYMQLSEGTMPAAGARISSVKRRSINGEIVPVIKERNAVIVDRFNEAVYTLSDRSRVTVRLYDNGAAYRLSADREGEITVMDEPTRIIVDTASQLVWQKTTINSSEYPYVVTTVGSAAKGEYAPYPLLLKLPGGERVVTLESDMQDYPVLWAEKDGECLKARFWKYPKSYRGGDNYYNIKDIAQYEDYMAKTSGKRDFPWRIFAIANEDKELLNNELVYQMAPECRIEDPSWVKPGWVLFDWWGKYGVYGVDFKAGMNTPTAKYMVDFASKWGIRYFLFDDGWTVDNDLTKCRSDLDISEVTRYGEEKGVDIMLWVAFDLLDDQMEKALDKFVEWGIKGIKIDFMDRDDQEVANFYWRAAKAAADRHMVIDFHGAYRPDGLRCAYPNVLTREGLMEFEFSAWSDNENPWHHCMLPFLRCVAGPADYIPGTVNNASKQFWKTNPYTPMGQGTRSHAMAMALVVESPMQMLPDGPTDYDREPECTGFLLSIPVEWDRTLPLDCSMGEYVSLARKNGNDWYVAAITNWDSRDMKIDLGFLEKGKKYRMEFFRDGANSDLRATDYVHGTCVIDGGGSVDVHLASGGGWLAKITEL